MRTIKFNYWSTVIVVMVFIISCSVKKDISLNELSNDKLIIIGTVEFDYSQLKNKNIKGIDLFLESDKKSKDFKLSEKYIPKENLKDYHFINKIGMKGNYELYYQQKVNSSETEKLITLMDMDRNTKAPTRNTLQKYTLNDCKIVNLGKIVIFYKGGDIKDGNITYSYSFYSSGDDTLALHAFRESYPLIYNSCRNDICIFRSELEECINYILKHISEEKSSVIKDFIKNHPDNLKSVFKDLSTGNTKKFAEKIESLTSEQLNDFLYKIK